MIKKSKPVRGGVPLKKGAGASTVIKALSILKLASMGAGIRASIVAKALEVDKSTGSRLIRTLASEGFLMPIVEGGSEYTLGPAVMELASSVQQRIDIQRVSLDVLNELRDLTEETVHIQRLMGDIRVCVAQVPSKHRIRWVLEVGETRPLTVGSSAKVLLAGLSDDEAWRMIKNAQALQYTVHTLDASTMMGEVQNARLTGYALNEGERIDGVTGISLPIKDWAGVTVAALSVSGPSSRWTNERMLKNLDALRAGADKISARIGNQNLCVSEIHNEY